MENITANSVGDHVVRLSLRDFNIHSAVQVLETR